MSSSSDQITYRVVISQAARSMQITVEPGNFLKSFLGKKIGEGIDGGLIGYPGYEFTITGGSDISGFPMRKDVQGGIKKRVLVSKVCTGLKSKSIKKGDRVRILVRGNTVTDQIVQVNCIVAKEGKVQLFVAKEGEAAAPAADGAEKPKDEKKKKKK